MEQDQRIETLHAKMARLVEEFAAGSVNRSQFHSLYERYQRQLMSAVAACSDPVEGHDWLSSNGAGEDSATLRSDLTARAEGLTIFEHTDCRTLATMGDFAVDPALLGPLLTGTSHIPANTPLANVRSTFVRASQWLGIVHGQYTTLFVLFSLEPSEQQLKTIAYMHRDFEAANRAILRAGLTAPDTLAFTFFSLTDE